MPAHALQAQAGWHIVDCCAAPGNKTTHVAALLAAAGGGSGSTSSQQGSKYKAGSKKRSRQQAEDTDRPATGESACAFVPHILLWHWPDTSVHAMKSFAMASFWLGQVVQVCVSVLQMQGEVLVSTALVSQLV